MYAKNVSVEDLEQALAKINELYEGNVIWNRAPERRGNRLMFTLRVKKSRGPGARVSWRGDRHLVAACWHVHGHFFDALLKINPDAEIITGSNGKTVINRNGGNWTDFNIGSQFQPCMASEACGCY